MARDKKKQVPQNPKLWNMLVNQAKAKFNTYPSIPANKWVHDEYTQRGGRFVTSRREDTRHHEGKETKKGREERKSEEKSEGKDKDKDKGKGKKEKG